MMWRFVPAPVYGRPGSALQRGRRSHRRFNSARTWPIRPEES